MLFNNVDSLDGLFARLLVTVHTPENLYSQAARLVVRRINLAGFLEQRDCILEPALVEPGPSEIVVGLEQPRVQLDCLLEFPFCRIKFRADEAGETPRSVRLGERWIQVQCFRAGLGGLPLIAGFRVRIHDQE